MARIGGMQEREAFFIKPSLKTGRLARVQRELAEQLVSSMQTEADCGDEQLELLIKELTVELARLKAKLNQKRSIK